jgi:hypothetical protein
MNMLTDLATRHLALRLRMAGHVLAQACERQASLAARLTRPDLTQTCITDQQVRIMIGDMDAMLGARERTSWSLQLEADVALERALRADAANAGITLPLDALTTAHDLSRFEQQALLLCAAPDIDSSYERIFGYLLDDMNRRNACVELLCLLDGALLKERMANQRALGPNGILRRSGMLRAWGDASSQLRQELRLGSGMLDCLCGMASATGFRDPAQVSCSEAEVSADIMHHGQALRGGRVAVLGVWGPPRSSLAGTVQGLALAACLPLRRWVGDDLAAALGSAAALGAMLWINLDGENAKPAARQQIANTLAASAVPVILSGVDAWRPLGLLAERAYAEMRIDAPDFDGRTRLWARALPDASPQRLAELAGRYRVGAQEVRATVRAAAGGSGVDTACAAVLRPSGQRLVTLVEPRRGPDDLILAPALHQQVMEVADFFRAWPNVAGPWGFGKLVTGQGGIKALFSGDSGTGKTLAAEVVAGVLGMPLLKIDLAQIVSKWVGETEKHLESVFSEAEDSHGVLFFDEADALFGKRGEVQHGVDRYANLEVSYLLQRIEDYAGLVILATNLKENIDAAFTRRFHATIHFPRPDPAERRRLWEIAFPANAPLETEIDLDLLSRLDLTGAGITSAARTAALLAAAGGSPSITIGHVARALVRQYQREARVLMPSELGPYAAWLQDGK